MTAGGICTFGEVLFDYFPDGKRVLGGAPFNVSWHLQAFGQAPTFVSRVGADSAGEAVREAMQRWGMRTDFLQTDPDLATGSVRISLEGGEPIFDIEDPSAWDAIAAEPRPPACTLFYHGTLAMRGPSARAATDIMRIARPHIIFLDVNLRPPWWQRQRVEGLLDRAHWVKLNGAELAELHGQSDAASFLRAHALEGLVLTHGADGAEIITADSGGAVARPAADVTVVDTVGAGDAFASVIILGLIQGWPLPLTAERAQDFATAIVGNRGATVSDPDFYRAFLDAWAAPDKGT
jgi:fructokinase